MLTNTSIKFLNSSNLNGPLLNTDWGAFIRLLDACLVDGINNLNISSLSISGSTPETSDLITLTYLTPHGYQQYQVILLSGSQVEALNKEHRIQSVSPDGLSLTFKINSNITDAGNTLNIMTKLAPLGWKKVFTEPFKAVYQMNSAEGPNHYFFVWNDNPNNMGATGYGAIWLAASHYLGFDYVDKPAGSSPLNLQNISSNTYYNVNIFRIGKTLYAKYNDVIIGSHILTNQQFNFAINNGCTIGASANFGVGTSFQGYIDNFKSHKEPTLSTIKANNVIETPAIHLPLETHPNNIGYNQTLVVTATGSPLYTTVDNKKCIKIETNKYLTVNSTNHFNLGDSTDFYLEMDFYKTANIYGVLISDYAGWTDGTSFLAAEGGKVSIDVRSPINSTSSVASTNTFEFNTWNNVKVFRKGTTLYIDLNGTLTTKENYTSNIQFARNGSNTCIGSYAGDTANAFNGYISNFKLFVGISELPDKFNEKAVLNLDFSPTNKSYLFKDKFNKCVIHPVNITQRDYQDSQYCLSLNGTNQYLSLGKNPSLNFGKDDCVIEVIFKPKTQSAEWGTLIGHSMPSATSMDFLMVTRSGTIECRINNLRLTTNTNIKVVYNEINKLLFIRNNKNVTINLNDNVVYDAICEEPFNLNKTDNTYIGRNGWDGTNGYFCGTLYSIKILRNTSDVSLLENK